MDASEIVKVVAGGLTILGVITGIIRYITQLEYKVKQERLEADNQKLKEDKDFIKERFLDLEAKYTNLANELSIAKRIGQTALVQKKEIDEQLLSIMNIVNARAGSIFIPFHDGTLTTLGLVFLSIHPFGRQAATLKSKVIPLKSLAGRCFLKGEPFVRSNSKKDPEHYDKADKVSGYDTEDVLNYPLRSGGRIVGVLQLLNKEKPGCLSEADLIKIEPFVSSLANKTAEFINQPQHLEILGITPERDAENATIIFCDLTNSRQMFKEMSPLMAIQHINEYFEKLSDIAFRFGATIDKYLGDGAIYRFNVPRPIDEHTLNAVKAAVEMKAAFEELKTDWITMGELVNGLNIRIGISLGQVYQAIIGHPQHQSLTVFGTPANVAVNMCEEAPRERNIIIIDEFVFEKLKNKITVEKIDKRLLIKSKTFISSAYELISIK